MSRSNGGLVAPLRPLVSQPWFSTADGPPPFDSVGSSGSGDGVSLRDVLDDIVLSVDREIPLIADAVGEAITEGGRAMAGSGKSGAAITGSATGVVVVVKETAEVSFVLDPELQDAASDVAGSGRHSRLLRLHTGQVQSRDNAARRLRSAAWYSKEPTPTAACPLSAKKP